MGLSNTSPVRPRLIAVDLDGTLLTSDRKVAPEGAEALRQAVALGVTVVISTTRTLDSVRRLTDDLGLKGPVVCANGAQVLSHTYGDLWLERVVPDEMAFSLARQADAQGWNLVITAGMTTYYRDGSWHPGPCRKHVSQNVDALKGKVLRILAYDEQAIVGLRSFCASAYEGHYHLETYYHEDESIKSIGIYAPGADKGKGLAEVMRRLDLNRDQVIVIGDNQNDLPMFERARWRIAMGNGTLTTRSAATSVAPTHDEEGVAWAVHRFVLGDTV
jgi:hypothetical protein